MGQGKVVYIAGVWDVINAAHIRHIEQARAAGSKLFAGVYSDAFSRASGYVPLFPEDQRMLVMAALRAVWRPLLITDPEHEQHMIARCEASVVAVRWDFGKTEAETKAVTELQKKGIRLLRLTGQDGDSVMQGTFMRVKERLGEVQS